MDPLSITAGAIAILQAIGTILDICYNTRAILKDKPWCLSRAQDEVRELRDVLEFIFQLSLDYQNSDKECNDNNALRLLAQSQSSRGPLILCLEDLRALEILLKKCTSQPRTRAQAIMRAVKWDLSQKDIKPILDRLARSKATLNLVVSADEVTLLLELKKWSMTMTNDIQCVHHSVNDLAADLSTRNIKIDAKTQQILEWLSPLDSWDSYASAIQRCHHGTGQWFLQSTFFKNWRDGGHPSIWLSGFTGSGKSVLFTRPLVAYFYCDFRSAATQNLTDLLGNIIRQVLLKSDSISDVVEDTFCLSRAVGSCRKPEVTFLLETLSMVTSESRLLVIIDALDEVEDEAQLLDFVRHACSELKNISFLVSSRESEDIRQSLNDFHHIRIEDQVTEVNEDITQYINHRLQVDPSLQWLSPGSQASGMFRWVQCQMENLSKLRTESVRRILLWVSFTISPLTLEELHTAIAIELDIDHLDEESLLRSPQDIVTLTGGLLSVTDKGNITLAHMSVKNYLLSPEIRQSKTANFFALSRFDCSKSLFRSCMRYISYSHFNDGPCRSAVDFLHRLHKFPLLKHAAISWPYYYRASDADISIEPDVMRFFAEESRNLFMSWVQVINAESPFFWDFYPRHATGLYYAATFGLTTIVRELIGSGVALDAPGSRYGGTALHGAVYRMHTPAVKLLLEAGADVNKADFLQSSPLHTAAALGDIGIVKLLLRFSANTEAVDAMGKRPVDWACRSGQMLIRDLLEGKEVSSQEQSTNYRSDGDGTIIFNLTEPPTPEGGQGRIMGEFKTKHVDTRKRGY
ncbi:hypothetical protein F5Y19DRAFT_466225 [Xylariaceae sp. FL1651]|nr:hypothetical protein F5Y19DRAFT_466225 [Xylariaceae sp. FL1651]